MGLHVATYDAQAALAPNRRRRRVLPRAREGDRRPRARPWRRHRPRRMAARGGRLDVTTLDLSGPMLGSRAGRRRARPGGRRPRVVRPGRHAHVRPAVAVRTRDRAVPGLPAAAHGRGPARGPGGDSSATCVPAACSSRISSIRCSTTACRWTPRGATPTAAAVAVPQSDHTVTIRSLHRVTDPLEQVFTERWEFVERDGVGQRRFAAKRSSCRCAGPTGGRCATCSNSTGFEVEREDSDFRGSPPRYGAEQVWTARKPA